MSAPFRSPAWHATAIEVVGVDVDQAKLDLIAAGKTPVVEEGMVELMAQRRRERTRQRHHRCRGRRAATARSRSFASARRRRRTAARTSRRSLRLAKRIGRALRGKAEPHVFVFRSTLVPGTVEDVLRPIIERESGKKDGVDFHVCFQPEFLREGSSIRDYDKPPFTVVGANSRSGVRAAARAVRASAVRVSCRPRCARRR